MKGGWGGGGGLGGGLNLSIVEMKERLDYRREEIESYKIKAKAEKETS